MSVASQLTAGTCWLVNDLACFGLFLLVGSVWSFLGYSGASHQSSVQVAGLHVFISVRNGDLVNILDYGSKQRTLPEWSPAVM